MFNQLLVILGIFLNATATLVYVVDTVKGKVQPNKATYFLWSIAPLVAFASQLSQGVGIQSLMTLSVGLFPLTVFIASFLNQKAFWELSKFDYVCGLLSLIGLILWYITKIGNIAIVFSIFADFLATLPTLVKGYKHPETEIGWPWLLAAISGLFTLISIEKWDFAHYGFPLYYLVTMLTLFVVIHFKIKSMLQKSLTTKGAR
jgi:hypothetical protein